MSKSAKNDINGKSKQPQPKNIDYEVDTNIKSLSKIKEIINNFNMENIPIIDFNNTDDEIENFIYMFVTELSSDEAEFNRFFRLITNTTEDFYRMKNGIGICYDISYNFFIKLPDSLLNTMRMSMRELQKRRDMAMKKNEKMMEKVAKETMGEKMEEVMKGLKEGNTEMNIENG